MRATLYSLKVSHPSMAARRMLELKGVEYRVVNALPGFHPVVVRAAGFPGPTVPALKLDGKRIQGTLQISRELDRIVPEPRLFPEDPGRRRAVEEAERWGDRELQEVPRRLFRWALRHHQAVRRWLAGEVVSMPAPGLMAGVNAPLAALFARISRAEECQVKRDLAALPALLDRVDGLIADGTIGGEAPNAADLQIASSVRFLLAFSDLREVVGDRPAADLALRLFPEIHEPVPPAFPPGWLATEPPAAG